METVSYTHLDVYKRQLNDRWAWFIGDNRQSLKLTTQPEPYTLDRTLRWVQRQVAPTLKMLKKIDKGKGTDYMETCLLYTSGCFYERCPYRYINVSAKAGK